ncbi:hypothetical protein D3C87_1889040 [compost metagenome]
MRRLGADQRFEWQAIDLSGNAQHGAGIAGMPENRCRTRIARDQATMPLNAAGSMDRLTIAIGQVDRFSHFDVMRVHGMPDEMPVRQSQTLPARHWRPAPCRLHPHFRA